MSRRYIYTPAHVRRRVGVGAILLHLILTCLTGGFWLVILFIRYMLR